MKKRKRRSEKERRKQIKINPLDLSCKKFLRKVKQCIRKKHRKRSSKINSNRLKSPQGNQFCKLRHPRIR
jgi:hypothetical protein